MSAPSSNIGDASAHPKHLGGGLCAVPGGGAAVSARHGHATGGLSAYYPGGFSTVTAIFPARIFKILCGFFRPEFSYIFFTPVRAAGEARLTSGLPKPITAPCGSLTQLAARSGTSAGTHPRFS